jgi:4-hydroxybenzoate polyprenyltransferase
MEKVKNYLSLIKFSHTIFAMPFAMIGFFLGLKHVGLTKNIHFFFNQSTNQLLILFLLVILCMVFARSAAMAFNRYLDKNFDAKNPRTAIREIPAGVLKAENVLLFTFANCLLFIVSAFFINKLCFYLSPVALAVVLGYSYTKRFTPFCHLVLGLGLSLAPIGAYLAVTGHFDILPILFSFTVLFWVSGFDIIYALQDEEFDKENNLYSMPAKMGKVKALFFSRFLHLISIFCIVIAGWLGGFGFLYWMGTIVFTGMLVYQHTIVKPDDLRKVNIAFMTANGIASVVFALFVIADLLIN